MTIPWRGLRRSRGHRAPSHRDREASPRAVRTGCPARSRTRLPGGPTDGSSVEWTARWPMCRLPTLADADQAEPPAQSTPRPTVGPPGGPSGSEAEDPRLPVVRRSGLAGGEGRRCRRQGCRAPVARPPSALIPSGPSRGSCRRVSEHLEVVRGHQRTLEPRRRRRSAPIPTRRWPISWSRSRRTSRTRAPCRSNRGSTPSATICCGAAPSSPSPTSRRGAPPRAPSRRYRPA